MSDTITIPSRANWFSGEASRSIFDDKSVILKDYMATLFNRTVTMFVYKDLPDTILAKEYLALKQTYGSATIIDYESQDENKNKSGLYACYGALGGVNDANYNPTISTVSNPYLNIGKSFDIDKNCIVIRNDLFYNGLLGINRKYAELLTECDISIRKCLLNIRIDNVFESSDTETSDSITAFYENIKKGDFGYITSKRFMEDTLLKIHDVAQRTANPLKDLIEMRNYIESCWWMLFGLNAQMNMKREALTDAELNADDKTMIPFIDIMLYYEKEGWDKVNKMYGTNVTVELSPLWKKVKNEVLEANEENPKAEVSEEESKDGEANEKD